MRITCPHCGDRSAEEFAYHGDATKNRPDGLHVSDEEIFDYVYIRANPAGLHREYWYHGVGCHSWLVVTRHTRTHKILEVIEARSLKGGEGT